MLTFPIRSGGAIKAVTSGTFTLSDPNGTAIVDAQDVAVTAGVPSYTLATSFSDSNEAPELNWREQWVLLIDGATETFEHDALLCRIAPERRVNEQNLYKHHSEWERFLPPGRASWDEVIDEAWEEMLRRLLGDLIIPHKLLNSWALVTCHTYWALHLAAVDFSTTETGRGKWSSLATRYEKRYEKEYDRLALKIDEDDDGLAEDPEALTSAVPELFLTAVPDISWGR